MSATKDLLLTHRRKILADHERELAAVDAALAALERPIAGGGNDGGGLSTKTTPGKIVAIVSEAPNGLTPDEVRETLRSRFNRTIKSESMGWYLSHLKKDGLVKVSNGRWTKV